MKNIIFTLVLLGAAGFTGVATAEDASSEAKDNTATQDKAATGHRVTPEELKSGDDKTAKQGQSSKDDKAVTQDKSAKDVKQDKSKKSSDKQDPSNSLAAKASSRSTPPWTNDSANVNQQQSRQSLESEMKPYSKDDFAVKDVWKKRFEDPKHFSTTSGKELYHTLCQACHTSDGQGAHGAGDYPSFAGNERLRSPYYPIDVIINGFRGMPGFGDMLSNEQIADVVDYLRTSFGNQLEADTTPDDVARVRHEQ